jgi:hypothetical protein
MKTKMQADFLLRHPPAFSARTGHSPGRLGAHLIQAGREEIAGICYPKARPGFTCSTPNRCFAYLKDLPPKRP